MPAPDTGLEIELKCQVPPQRQAALTRALATRTAERVDLRARYFDTPDGRLAAAQLALRLRREGEVWVQTLKGRGDGLMQRLEDEVPRDAEDGDPPPLDIGLHRGTAAGQALRAALAGGPPPQVVYGTQIQRLKRVLRHGGARIELALDVGDIVAGEARTPVCELEFELLSGPVSALLDLAARWSARFGLVLDPATKSERAQWLVQARTQRPVVRASDPALPAGLPLAEARAAMVASALAQALPNAAALTSGGGHADHVHQLRVGLRRLRSVLRAFGPEDAARDAALGALFGALGGTRDADVLALTLGSAWAAAQAAGLPVAAAPAPVAAHAGLQRLHEPTTTALWLGLIALTVPGPTEAVDDAAPWESVALPRLRRWHRQARRDAQAWATLDDEARHRLRKRLKRLRYVLGFCSALLPAKAWAEEARALRRLQDALGRWNDAVVARAALAPALPGDAVAAFATGWLAREALLIEADCARATRRWQRLKGRVLKPKPKSRG
jgi:inorganic triphosphatase YgiF